LSTIKEENREFLNDMISEDDMELQIDEPPMFSLKARNKAYELHRADPDYWSPLRLSNYFKKKSDYIKVSLWASRLEEEAKILGLRLDDELDLLAESVFGVTAFPEDIGERPQSGSVNNSFNTFFFYSAGGIITKTYGLYKYL